MKSPEILDDLLAKQAAATVSREPLGRLLGKEFRFNKARRTVALREYCRFRYLALIADKPVVPPPILSELWERDKSVAESAGMVTLVNPGLFSLRALAVDSGYQRTLDLYRQEFGVSPPSSVWPSPKDLIRTGKATIAMLCGFAVAFAGGLSGLVWLGLPGFLVFSICFIWLAFRAPWGVLKPGD